MPEPPTIVACALIEQGGRVLIAQRPVGKHLAGKWEFPGGKIEAGETGADALRREIREELGIEIEVRSELPPVVHRYGESVIRLIPFHCVLRAGEPHPHEHAAVRWCTPAEIATLDLAAADRPILDHWRARDA